MTIEQVYEKIANGDYYHPTPVTNTTKCSLTKEFYRLPDGWASFEADALECFGLTGNPYAEVLFETAVILGFEDGIMKTFALFERMSVVLITPYKPLSEESRAIKEKIHKCTNSEGIVVFQED